MQDRKPSPSRLSTSMRRASVLAVAAFSLAVVACGGGGPIGRKQSERANWVDKPTQGTQKGKLIKIPGLQISFEQPDVLYVYKNCTEVEHRKGSVEGPLIESDWIPLVRCESQGEGESLALTFFVSKDDRVINERAVPTYKNELKAAGFDIDSVEFYDAYNNKPGRRGIEVKVRKVSEENQYEGREIQQLIFPKGDVHFIAHIDVAMGANRAGINGDWGRILWNFQLDEDGPLHEGQTATEDEEGDSDSES